MWLESPPCLLGSPFFFSGSFFPESPSLAATNLGSRLEFGQAFTVLCSNNKPHIIIIGGKFGEKIQNLSKEELVKRESFFPC